AGGCYATLLGHDGKGQKSTPVCNEAREQKCGRKRIGVRAPSGEAQRHSRINEKVERDIKESAAISRPRCTRDRTIEPIGDAVSDQKGHCNVKLSSRDGERSRKSYQTSPDSDGVCADPSCRKQLSGAYKGRIDQSPDVGIDHGLCLP